MTLFLFTQYALIVALIALIVIILSLLVKSAIDHTVFQENMLFATQMQQDTLKQMFNAPESDFDEHVTSTPGMQPFLHTPN
jgi:ABC-type multidrug transport system fused ATPase/permease subunit